MYVRTLFFLFFSLFCFACKTPSASDAGAAPVVDAGAAPVVDAGAAPVVDAGAAPLAAADYCETIAPFFCEYYLRCGRMAGVENVAECHAVFLSSCNDGYEQRYIDLENEGLLSLSSAGIESCQLHLQDVRCEEQIRDLDGPCAEMWQGSSPPGSQCGLDVEGFVCGAGSACQVDVSFCGTCETGAAIDEACSSDVDCLGTLQCAQGRCTPRALPGNACDDEMLCAVGAYCEANFCVGPNVVAVGDSCNQRDRCPYKSACIGGICVEQPLVGDACTENIGCASGQCLAGLCAPRLPHGEPCSSSNQCRSRQCLNETCTALPGGCITN